MMMVKIKKNCCSRFLEKYDVLPETFVVKIKNRFVDVIHLILHNTFRYLTHLYYSSFQVPSTCPCAWNQLIHCRMCK